MRYKILVKNIGEISKLPEAQQIFGYLFSTYLRENNLTDNSKINLILDQLQNQTLQISDCMPNGYIHNPNIPYIINSVEEPYTSAKSNLQKKYKKPDYIAIEYLENHLKKINNIYYLQMEMDFENHQHNFITFSTTNVQHKNGRSSFLTNKINIPTGTNLYFLIECEERLEQVIKSNLKPGFNIPLGPRTSTGKNLFEVINIEKQEEVQVTEIRGVILSQYIPATVDEINIEKCNGNIKVKSKSARPSRMFKGISEDTRFLYNYIEPGNLIAIDGHQYGMLLPYKGCSQTDYNPRIFGKSYIYNFEEYNE